MFLTEMKIIILVIVVKVIFLVLIGSNKEDLPEEEMHKKQMDKQKEKDVMEVSLNTFSNANNP